MTLMDELLQMVSRTFALSIPRLPEPTRREATVAYLLMRIADTYEDTTSAAFADRVAGLDAFCGLMADPHCTECRAVIRETAERLEVQNPGERATMDAAAQVMDAYALLRPQAQRIIARTCTQMAQGMKHWIHRTDTDGHLRLKSFDELRSYCYVVAGIVGEMLTELYVLQDPSLATVEAELQARALAFGEGVQLVNILKDVQADAAERRQFLPADLPLSQVFRLARKDLAEARQYVEILRAAGAPAGIVAFNQITLQLGTHALDVTEAHGAGAKVTRAQVQRILAAAPA